MDIVTQALLGAAVAQSAAKKGHTRIATLVGLVAGVVADADVLIRSSADPLVVLEYHRHFTHSIFFIPVGAGIAFLLLWPFLRRHLSARHLYRYCFFGYLLSGFLDACTSYGTHLLWPLLDTRFSWHIISIVDPLFTLVLLTAVTVGYSKSTQRFSRIGIVLASIYLAFALVQMNRAEGLVRELAEERGDRIEQHIVKPTFGNTLLWRSVYLSNSLFYVDVIRVGVTKRIYQGASIEQFNLQEALPGIDTNSVLYKDIRRFEIFSDDYVIRYPGRPEILGDIRYSMNPLGITPLWGIEIDVDDTERHVKFANYRTASSRVKRQFLDMLLGRDLADQH